ncbi:MAG: type II toxin-antitoxin system Phd/YefM family antitoxin [Nitrospiraceae bacterium]
MTKTLPISEACTRLPDLVEAATRTMDRVIITRNGKPEAVLMGHEEFERAWQKPWRSCLTRRRWPRSGPGWKPWPRGMSCLTKRPLESRRHMPGE